MASDISSLHLNTILLHQRYPYKRTTRLKVRAKLHTSPLSTLFSLILKRTLPLTHSRSQNRSVFPTVQFNRSITTHQNQVTVSQFPKNIETLIAPVPLQCTCLPLVPALFDPGNLENSLCQR